MTWTINPTVTVNGVSYTANAVGAISIDYGRNNVWESQRAGYARIQLINLDNTAFPIDLNQSVVVQVKNYAGTSDITIFTGVVSNIENSVVLFETETTLAGITITAVAPLAVLARTQVGLVDYPAETDNDRISRIFSECDVSVAPFDPPIYNYIARPASPNNALTLANYYALMATGSIYETTTGEIGYDSQYSRNLDVEVNGYFAIDPTYVNFRNLKSASSIGELINNVNLQYNGDQYFTTYLSASQALYGDMQATIKTEIADTDDAQNVAGLYLAMRAYPNTSLSNIEIRLIDPTISSTTVDKMLNMYFGMPVSMAGAPVPIYDGTYYGFVEGWNLQLNQVSARITLRTSEKTYSYRPYVWEAIDPATQWDSIDPTAVKTTKTNLVLNPSFETNTTGWTSTGITQTRITTDSVFGSASDQAVATSTATNIGMVLTRNATYAIPITPNNTYTINVYMKRTVGTRTTNFRFITKATAASGTAIETFTSGNISASNAWEKLTITCTPTNASGLFAEIFLRFGSTGSIGDTFLADGIIAYEGSSVGYYWDGTNTDIPSSRVATLAWTGTANGSTSTANAYFSTIPTTTWQNVDTVGLP